MSYKKWIFIAISIFGIGLVLGLFTPSSIANPISEEIAALEELGARLVPFSVFTLVVIFLRM